MEPADKEHTVRDVELTTEALDLCDRHGLCKGCAVFAVDPETAGMLLVSHKQAIKDKDPILLVTSVDGVDHVMPMNLTDLGKFINQLNDLGQTVITHVDISIILATFMRILGGKDDEA